MYRLIGDRLNQVVADRLPVGQSALMPRRHHAHEAYGNTTSTGVDRLRVWDMLTPNALECTTTGLVASPR